MGMMRYDRGQELRAMQISEQCYCCGCRKCTTQTVRQLGVFRIYNTKTVSRGCVEYVYNLRVSLKDICEKDHIRS